MLPVRRLVRFLAACLILPLALTGCSGSGVSEGSDASNPNALRILAGSEIKDLVPLLDKASSELSFPIDISYSGTLQGAEQIAAGEADGKYDAVWFSSNRYLSLIGEARDKVATSEKIMVSPVVMGVKSAKAKELGWDSSAPSWGDIATASAGGKFTYGMTNPSASNSGFSALVAVATALAGGGAALDAQRVEQVTDPLKKFFTGQTLTSGSSGWLATKYKETQGPSAPDGIVNYESVILQMQKNGVDIVPIYPSDGVVTADYPLTLLKSATGTKREAYNKLVEWLKKDEHQRTIMADTSRRPISPSVQPGSEFSTAVLVELPFPGQRSVVDGLIGTYLNKIRRPSQTVYVLDTSGSMRGHRIDSLKKAFQALAGADTSAQGSFSAFREREHLEVFRFSSDVTQLGSYDIPEGNADSARQAVRQDVDGLKIGGDTAMYDALYQGYQKALELRSANPEFITTVVLLTDGEWTAGRTLGEFKDDFKGLPEDAYSIPTFAVLFGDSVPEDLEAIAELTGGRVFDARKDGLTSSFQEIRGYQ